MGKRVLGSGGFAIAERPPMLGAKRTVLCVGLASSLAAAQAPPSAAGSPWTGIVPWPPTVRGGNGGAVTLDFVPPTFVDLRTDSDVPSLTLQMETPADDWVDVCTSPCTGVPLDAMRRHRVRGDGMPSSDALSLRPGGTHIVQVNPGSTMQRVLGVLLLPTSLLLEVASVETLLRDTNGFDGCGGKPCQTGDASALFYLGLGALAAGIVLIATSGTSVKVDPSKTGSAPSPNGFAF